MCVFTKSAPSPSGDGVGWIYHSNFWDSLSPSSAAYPWSGRRGNSSRREPLTSIYTHKQFPACPGGPQGLQPMRYCPVNPLWLCFIHVFSFSDPLPEDISLSSHIYIILCSCAGLSVYLFDNVVSLSFSLHSFVVELLSLTSKSFLQCSTGCLSILQTAACVTASSYFERLQKIFMDQISTKLLSSDRRCWWISHCLLSVEVLCSFAWFLSVLDKLVFLHCPHKRVLWAKNVSQNWN